MRVKVLLVEVLVVIVVGSIASLNVAVTVVFVGTPSAFGAGVSLATVGGKFALVAKTTSTQ